MTMPTKRKAAERDYPQADALRERDRLEIPALNLFANSAPLFHGASPITM